MATVIRVRHNVEVAHRIHALDGKCQNIHGHSMWVTMELVAYMENGIAVHPRTGNVLDFGMIKRVFRDYLDTRIDHGLYLSKEDPIVGMLEVGLPKQKLFLVEGLASTENLACVIRDYMKFADLPVSSILVDETHVNAAQVV